MQFSARMAGAQESLGASPTARLEFVRAWETLRAERFSQADWFHPPEAVKPGEPPDFERAAQRLLTTSQSLKTLLATAPAEMEPFGEGEVTLRRNDSESQPAEDQRLLAAWRAWVPGWQARVDAGLSDFPKPDEVPNELHYAYESLVRAAGAARQPPNPGPGAFVSGNELNALYLPDKRSRKEWVRGVSGWLSELPAQVNAARKAKVQQ